jgi:hypothetical protein
MTPRRERVLDALALGTLKLALGAWVLHTGFTHVSDDDYARTAIAEGFAHAPRLDPSGTSWLPFPFWLEGLAMAVVGRSLAVARGVALVLGAASVAAPYLAMRAAGLGRAGAVIASAIAMAIPYSAWLGAATVPEAWVGAMTAAALLAMTDVRARPWCAAALLAASLSRYEAWPACAVFALFCALQARHGSARARDIACAVVAAMGPIAWMAWNAHAHGSALHFIARVSRFRHAIGAADVPFGEKLIGYPRSLLVDTPEVAALAIAAAVGLRLDPALRARWGWTAATAAVVLGFLVLGDLGDGAPTHHPARALCALWWISVAMGVDAIAAAILRTRRPWRAAVVGLAGAFVGAWAVTLSWRLRDAPGESDAERRHAQIERGLSMRARDVAGAEITPCAFEHFALIAAWGAPERASVNPRTGEPVTPACPQVEEH